MEWKSIETAPKCGSNILIFSKACGVMEAAWWSRWYSDITKQGWMPANFDEEYGSYIDDATHWMPLPQPPKD